MKTIRYRIVTLCGALTVCGLVAAAEQRAPNILFILADDLGYADLSCQGSADIRTPAIDALAKKGIRFTDAYVTSPQCGPSRAGIMTGVNQARFSYMYNGEHCGLPDPKVLPLMPEILKSAGYRTVLVGKWHIGQGTEYLIKDRSDSHMEPLPPKRIACAKPWKRGFDEGFFIVGGGGWHFPFKLPYSNHPRSHFYTFDTTDNPQEIRLGEDAYKNDFLTDAALKFLQKPDDRPFFMYLSYTLPHGPLQAREVDLKANSHIQDRKRRTFAAMMTRLDTNIGRVLQLLDKKGLRENTLIVFMSDNGGPTKGNTSKNDPFTGAKGDLHEGGIRIPCIMSWQGVFPEGTLYSKAVSSLDLLPTFAAAAGTKIRDDIMYDGTDLTPYLKRNSKMKTAPHDALYWRWSSKKALRFGDYKWLDAGSKSRTRPTTGLFNLAKSPVESKATLLKSPERLHDMLRRDEDYWAKHFGEFTPDNTAASR